MIPVFSNGLDVLYYHAKFEEDRYQKWKFLPFWGRVSTPEPIGVKFRVAKRTHVPLGCDKVHVNRYNESPMRGENADF